MDTDEQRRLAAVHWVLGRTSSGRPPADPEAALRRASDLLEVVGIYFYMAVEFLGDTDEVRSLAKVVDTLRDHEFRMQRTVLQARDAGR